MKHRKLFPDSLSSKNNETLDCQGFCDPSCPYNCYPYTDYDFTPPPPPPSLPLSVAGESGHFSPYVILAICLLGGFFLLLSYYVIVAKSFFGWCSFRNNNRRDSGEGNVTDEEEILDNNDRFNHDSPHPIWLIATVGLQQSIINSINVVRYKKDEGLTEGTECSVCLNEFREDDTLRLLPKCNHAFHIPCIDTWLNSHTNCPLCRALIVAATSGAAAGGGGSDFASVEVIESGEYNLVPDLDTTLDDSREVRTDYVERISDNMMETTESDSRIRKEGVDRLKQPLRRSASMDSSRCSTVDECLHKCSGVMLRSMSCPNSMYSTL